LIEFNEIIVAFSFVAANFLIIYSLTAITPRVEVVNERALFELDCMATANIFAISINNNSKILEQYDGKYLDLHPKYLVKFEVRDLESNREWTIGEVPENLPENYRQFVSEFILPTSMEGNLTKINTTCVKAPLGVMAYNINKYCNENSNFTVDFGSRQTISLEENFICATNGKKVCKLLKCDKTIELPSREIEEVNVRISDKIVVEVIK